MERLQYICTTEDDGLEVLTLLRREFRVSTNLLRQLKVTENGIMLDDTRVTVRHTVQPGQVLSILREPDSGKERRKKAHIRLTPLRVGGRVRRTIQARDQSRPRRSPARACR